MKWYDWGSVREQLKTFGRAVQGVSPYKVTIEPNPSKCPTGWCDYSRREIAVNPTLFPLLSPADQYRATKAILVHEAAHRRFTTPHPLDPVIHQVFNILEDERIERLMSLHFAGLGYLLEFLSGEMLNDLPPLNSTSESAVEILNFILRLRWAERVNIKVIPAFSPLNSNRWQQVEPLMRKAWEAKASTEVVQISRDVAAILDLHEIPEWLLRFLSPLGGLEGRRSKTDKEEKGSAGIPTKGERHKHKEEDFDGLPLPNDDALESGEQKIQPAPYLALAAEVKPLVDELVKELEWRPMPVSSEPEIRGQRISVRQWIRQPAAPFLTEQESAKDLPTFAFRVIIDHSTSMNSGERMKAARRGALLLHLVGMRLNISHVVTLTPNDIRLADLTSGERGLALIAGLVGQMGYEGIHETLAKHASEIQKEKADIKLILIIHDGYPDHPEILKSLCQTLRGKVEVIGVGLDYDERMQSAMRSLFGNDRLILCKTPKELPKKLGTILRNAYKG